jgi:hypothetical protein
MGAAIELATLACKAGQPQLPVAAVFCATALLLFLCGGYNAHIFFVL